MSLPDYINRLRIALAEQLVTTTRLDMEHVAERAGFASSRQLRRAWRRINPPRPAPPAGPEPQPGNGAACLAFLLIAPGGIS